MRTKEKGITLVALVITIIILLILVGVSISALTGSGLFSRALEAKEENDKQTATETINLKITNIQISSYTENKELPTLQYLADKLCEDDDMEYVTLASKTIASLDKIDVSNVSSIYTKLKDYSYEFEINSSLQLASIDGIKIANNTTVSGYPNIIEKIEETNNVETFEYNGSYYKYITPAEGFYKIECWGAQGGSGTYSQGGKGSYTSGIIKLNRNQELFIFVGGTTTNQIGGYNGGGRASSGCSGGGGATDIRLSYENENDFLSLKSRIMVSAGGGGSYNYSSQFKQNGGAGGTFLGVNGFCSSGTAAQGGSQTIGGLGTRNRTNTRGLFAVGGDGTKAAKGWGSGGGGGYYGGGAGDLDGGDSASGAGGSSYVSGYGVCNAISSLSTEDNVIHTGQSIHYSGKYFILGKMIAGNEQMPDYNSTNMITGNSGNGYAKITQVILK